MRCLDSLFHPYLPPECQTRWSEAQSAEPIQEKGLKPPALSSPDRRSGR